MSTWTTLAAIAGPLVTLIVGYFIGFKRQTKAPLPITDARTDAQKAQDASQLKDARKAVREPSPASRAGLENLLRETEIATGHLDRTSRPPSATH